jgi:hypothetical protein
MAVSPALGGGSQGGPRLFYCLAAKVKMSVSPERRKSKKSNPEYLPVWHAFKSKPKARRPLSHGRARSLPSCPVQETVRCAQSPDGSYSSPVFVSYLRIQIDLAFHIHSDSPVW